MEEIEEQYVSVEIAKLLNQLGFDRKCRYVWAKSKRVNNTFSKVPAPLFIEGELIVQQEGIDSIMKGSDCEYEEVYLCPTHDLVRRWIEKKLGKIIIIGYYQGVTPPYDYRIFSSAKRAMNESSGLYITYDEAMEEAFKQCLKNY